MSIKSWYGPPPPAELASAELLSQGAEARIWLLKQQLSSSSQSPLTNSSSTTCNEIIDANPSVIDNNNEPINPPAVSSSTRTLHVGGGIYVPHITHVSQLSSIRINSQQINEEEEENDHHQKEQLESSTTSYIIVKERFPKKYRHPNLDTSLTKTRTKGEARALLRCWKAGVTCPNVLGIAHWSSAMAVASPKNNNIINNSSLSSSCLFLECIEGCTVRQYLEYRSSSSTTTTATTQTITPLLRLENDNGDECNSKNSNNHNKRRCLSQTREEEAIMMMDEIMHKETSVPFKEAQERRQYHSSVTTPIDCQTLCVANCIGQLIAKMHISGIIHGDLTTSNIMLRNPPWMQIGNIILGSDGNRSQVMDQNNKDDTYWRPQLALIDFGLASSTTPTTNNSHSNSNRNTSRTKSSSSSNHKKLQLQQKQQQQHQQQQQQQQQHNHPNVEEKAVDLYVLERAFLSTHPGSEKLVLELWNGYTDYYTSLDEDSNPACGGSRNIIIDRNDDDDVVDDDEYDNANESIATRGVSSRHHALAAKMIFTRLDHVRMRGRKRECFG